eukprot:SAG31_NODE_1513_length_8045_cov_5.748804_11_plen_122_part_01
MLKIHVETVKPSRPIASCEITEAELEALQGQYQYAFGFAALGPRSRQPAWLLEQLSYKKDDLRAQYKRRFHQPPSKTATAEWLAAALIRGGGAKTYSPRSEKEIRSLREEEAEKQRKLHATQ